MNTVLQTLGFYLFGFGSRRKLLFQNNALKDARNGEIIRQWDAVAHEVDASEYSVRLQMRDGREVLLKEDESGVWLYENGERQCLTAGDKVLLPRFENHPHSAILRALHADILVNIGEFGPVPNLWVYPKPWYRDAAMMAMVLKATGNLALLEKWILNLPREFDFNNNGHHEADNPGQILYLLSLVTDSSHPMVPRVLDQVKLLQKDDYICGFTDYGERPVFQTKWLKFGLQALGLDDPYVVPELYDRYSSLFWMDFRDQHVDGPRFNTHDSTLYPYLRWAEAHFHNEAPPLHLLNARYPFTWEGAGSEAYYAGIEKVSPQLAAQRWCAPHTWHAAEAFLYLIEKTHR